MERLHLPHDREIENVGVFALRAALDELFEASDKEVHRILTEHMEDERE